MFEWEVSKKVWIIIIHELLIVTKQWPDQCKFAGYAHVANDKTMLPSDWSLKKLNSLPGKWI